jgi:predicted enzyme related to lactoylglutathione lyase
MGEVERYPHGTMCWTDLETTDVEGAKRFHSVLLGWEFEDAHGARAPYTMCRVGEHTVAAIYRQPEDHRDVAPHWNVYISVDGVDAATARAVELGATVVRPPADQGDSGRMSVIADPGGAHTTLWEAGASVGATLVNEPGAWTWSDLGTRDTEAARRFYGELFGWESREVYPQYFSVSMGDLLIGAIRDIGSDPPGTQPYWMPYFVVDDIEASAARVPDLGGRILVQPTEVPAGRFEVHLDATGALEALFEMGPEGASRGVDGS